VWPGPLAAFYWFRGGLVGAVVEAVVLISYEAIFQSLTFHGKERCHVVARPSQDVA